MVVRIMRWRPWPARKYEVRVVVRRVEGWRWVDSVEQGAENQDEEHQSKKLTVEIRWKGPPKLPLMRRRSVKRDCTKAGSGNDVVFEWEEEFQSFCNLSPLKENLNSFHPWEIDFSLLDGSKQGQKNKAPVLATASLNIAEYASVTEQKEFDLRIPLNVSGSTPDPCPSLHILLSLLEIRTTQDNGDSLQKSIAPVLSASQPGETPPAEKDELSALKAGLRKVKILTDYVSIRRAKKEAYREEEGSEGRCSAQSDDGDYPFDTDSFEELGDGEIDEGKNDGGMRKSFSYGTLACANYAGGLLPSSTWAEDWIYYSHRKSDVGCSVNEDTSTSICEPPLVQSSKRSILPWRKRKLSPKAKGEPLLKKAYAEEGGDDIDFDRRQLSSDESISFGWHKAEEDLAANRSSISEFGEDSFAVGSWEHKEIVSRDGQMKLYSQVFFASIDQRNEKAAGESACTALVAVIADWFHNNHDMMPVKSQFDSLIRDGSLEWRKLCENETYRDKFPDKHFDLETVLQAKIRPLSVLPGKSFVGFFHPEEETDEGKFDFLHGSMSFDGIWDEISRVGSESLTNGGPLIYIVSWNDHFFILKMEADAYYIIDTLGERLYEGCDRAYILKFDKDTKIVKLPPSPSPEPLEEKPVVESRSEEPVKSKEEEVVCRGKEACKEYIKAFLAALPIRELLDDLKKGLVASTPLHRLQIECHYTGILPCPVSAEKSTSASLPRKGMEVSVSEIAA